MAKIIDKMRNFFGGDDYDDDYDEYDDYESTSYRSERETMDYAPSTRTTSASAVSSSNLFFMNFAGTPPQIS